MYNLAKGSDFPMRSLFVKSFACTSFTSNIPTGFNSRSLHNNIIKYFNELTKQKQMQPITTTTPCLLSHGPTLSSRLKGENEPPQIPLLSSPMVPPSIAN